MEHFFTHHGLPLLFVVIMLESFGIPLPGETALIVFGVLAAQGHYDLAAVVAVAATAAIVGDNLGYWIIGRIGGRALFRRWRWLFWLAMIAFLVAPLEIPAGILQLLNVFPIQQPAWYVLLRMATAIVECALGVWMLLTWRRCGVWAEGRARRAV